MKKIIILLGFIAFVSCSESPEQKMESVLKDVVVEKSGGALSGYKMLSIDIDTIRVTDIKQFIEKNFPKEEFPDGVPADFKDEKFESFIAPLKTKQADNDVVYLSVKHKYSFFNPFFNKDMEKIDYRLIVPETFKYISDDIRQDKMWTAIHDYKMEKAFKDAQKAIRELQ